MRYETTGSRRGLVGTAASNCLPRRHTFRKLATSATDLHQCLNRKSERNSVVRVGGLEDGLGSCPDYDCFALARERWSFLDVEVHTDPAAEVLGDEVDHLWSESRVNGLARRTQQADNKESTYGYPSSHRTSLSHPSHPGPPGFIRDPLLNTPPFQPLALSSLSLLLVFR